jgi:hypothetical protein
MPTTSTDQAAAGISCHGRRCPLGSDPGLRGGGEGTGGAGSAEHPRWRETWPRLQLIVARTEARKAVSVASLSPGTALGGRLA